MACVALVTLQATKTITPPSMYMAWFNSNGASHIGRMFGELLVVGSLGLGLPAFVGAVTAFRLGRPVMLHWLLFVVAALLCVLVLLPWLHDSMRFGRVIELIARPWWRYGAEFSLLVPSLVALWSSRLKARTRCARLGASPGARAQAVGQLTLRMNAPNLKIRWRQPCASCSPLPNLAEWQRCNGRRN